MEVKSAGNNTRAASLPGVTWLDLKGQTRLGTQNFVSGNRVYGERIVFSSGREYRIWDPYRSKLAAGILKGLKIVPFEEGTAVLYLGVSTGTTASHLSDIIGKTGVLFGVEMAPRVGREFIENVAEKRSNIVPIIADAKRPELYNAVFKNVDVIYCDIAQQDQTRIAIRNCERFLQKNGYLMLVVKARSIDSVKAPKIVFKEEVKKLESGAFKIIQKVELEPYDRDHALILAKYQPD